jgi:hypothetical protein
LALALARDAEALARLAPPGEARLVEEPRVDPVTARS